jgi:drug/metabolite transporter (DMT)-like permease
MALVLAGCSALLYGIADFAGGFAAGRSRLLSVLVLSQLLGASIALIALAVIGQGSPAPKDLMWGFIAGLTGSMGLFMLYGGIANSIVAIVSPTSAVVGAIIPVLFAVILGERPSTSAIMGSLLCLPAILLLTWEGNAEEQRQQSIKSALVYGVLAGLGFGIFFTSLSRARPGAGAWPLVAARIASITAFVIAMIASRQPFRVERKGLAPTLIAGVADMGANILFLLASQSGMLSLVAIITSLFPAPTVILARIFLHQRIPPVRLAGLVLALVGVGLISLH